MAQEQDEQIFAQFRRVLPVVQKIVRANITIGMCDREKYIFSLVDSKIDTGVRVGMPLVPNTAIVRAMEEQQCIAIRGDKEKFGVPYLGAAAPIYGDDGRVIGAVAFVEAVDIQDAVCNMAVKLADAINVIASTTEEISAQTQEVASVCDRLGKLSRASQARVHETSRILDMIRGVAGQTNLLGINAAIEAARVGEQGRGFGVVATEIRKLADNSAESVKRIAEIIQSIKRDSENNQAEIQTVGEMTGQVAQAIGHVAEVMQDIGKMAMELDQIALRLNHG